MLAHLRPAADRAPYGQRSPEPGDDNPVAWLGLAGGRETITGIQVMDAAQLGLPARAELRRRTARRVREDLVRGSRAGQSTEPLAATAVEQPAPDDCPCRWRLLSSQPLIEP